MSFHCASASSLLHRAAGASAVAMERPARHRRHRQAETAGLVKAAGAGRKALAETAHVTSSLAVTY